MAPTDFITLCPQVFVFADARSLNPSQLSPSTLTWVGDPQPIHISVAAQEANLDPWGRTTPPDTPLCLGLATPAVYLTASLMPGTSFYHTVCAQMCVGPDMTVPSVIGQHSWAHLQ